MTATFAAVAALAFFGGALGADDLHALGPDARSWGHPSSSPSHPSKHKQPGRRPPLVRTEEARTRAEAFEASEYHSHLHLGSAGVRQHGAAAEFGSQLEESTDDSAVLAAATAADLDVETVSKDALELTPTYGFYIHMAGEKVAVTHQLRQIRRFYPEAPVYIMSDGGANVSGICSKVGNCKFAWRAPAHDCWNPKPFLDRFREGALWLQSRHAEWTIMLEPDVSLWKRATFPVKADAGGLRDMWNSGLGQGLRDHITELGRNFSGKKNFRLLWDRFGMAGGSIYRTSACVISFKPDFIDWPLMEKFGGVAVYSSDIAMVIALAAHGYNWYPWEDVFEGKDENQPKHQAAFEHHRKYKDPLTAEELLLVADGPDERRGLQIGECQHCVWAEEEECWPKRGNKNIIQCPTDTVAFRQRHWPIEAPRPELFASSPLDWSHDVTDVEDIAAGRRVMAHLEDVAGPGGPSTAWSLSGQVAAFFGLVKDYFL